MNPQQKRASYGRITYLRPTKTNLKPKPPRQHKWAKRIFVFLAIVVTAAVVLLLITKFHSFGQKLIIGGTKPNNSFNTQEHSVTLASSPWVVVNKKNPLSPIAYTPGSLISPDIAKRSNITDEESLMSAEAARALEKLTNAAGSQGINLNLQSGYRSYQFQKELYDLYVAQQGQAAADTESARAGYSEHQTGLAADLGSITNPDCNLKQCFANTKEGEWLADNAYKYGFLLRYPADKENVTGYVYEPWHIRYVGTDLSMEMHNRHIETLEEFFGLAAAPGY